MCVEMSFGIARTFDIIGRKLLMTLAGLIIDYLPMLKRAVETFEREWADDGEMRYLLAPDLFGVFMEVLLHVEPSPARDELISKGFQLLNEMTAFDEAVSHDLVSSVAAYEPFRAAAAVWGNKAVREWGWYDGSPPLDPYRSNVWLDPDDIYDEFGVRAAIAEYLGISVDDLPGESR